MEKIQPKTTKELKKILKNNGAFDSVSFKKGVFTVRRSFFYRHGGSSQKLADLVKINLPMATIIDHGEVWKPFNGGASVAQGSHWFVKFAVPNPEVANALHST